MAQEQLFASFLLDKSQGLGDRSSGRKCYRSNTDNRNDTAASGQSGFCRGNYASARGGNSDH